MTLQTITNALKSGKRVRVLANDWARDERIRWAEVAEAKIDCGIVWVRELKGLQGWRAVSKDNIRID